MHKYFAEWYRAAGLEPKAEDLEKRWEALEAFGNDIEVVHALELVRIFYSRPHPAGNFIDEYASSFHEVDKNFPMRENALELQVLSGATIAHIVETTRTTVTDAIALAMVCGFCQGLRKDLLNGEIVDYARTYLASEAAKVREGTTFQIATPDVDLKDLLEALPAAASGTPATVKVPVRPPFEKLADAILNLSSSVNAMGQSIANEITARREESDILWWVFGEHSRESGKRMSELLLPFASLVAGKELADLVRLIPGPLAARAFLDKMLRFVDAELVTHTSIKEAINSAPSDWKERVIAGGMKEVGDLCPIHVAAAKSLEASSPTGWLGPFDKSTGLKSRTSIAPLDLASQIYHERVLMSAFNAAGSS